MRANVSGGRKDDILVIAGWDHGHVSALGSKNSAVVRSSRSSAIRSSVLKRYRAFLRWKGTKGSYSLREAGRTAPGLRVVDGRIDANSHGAVSADVVLVGTVLTALSSDTLQLLLGRGIGVADLHQVALITNGLAMVALDDLLTHVTRLEAIRKTLANECNLW